jgi:ribosomal protein S18 acetylase RimI-like enzyme
MDIRLVLKKIQDIDFMYNNILPFLIKSELENYYPEIERWFIEKVIPDTLDGLREIYCITNEDEIIGINIIRHSIGKYSHKGAKICTLYVSEKYRNMGLGTWLMTNAINRIREKSGLVNIIMTIPEDKIKKW